TNFDKAINSFLAGIEGLTPKVDAELKKLGIAATTLITPEQMASLERQAAQLKSVLLGPKLGLSANDVERLKTQLGTVRQAITDGIQGWVDAVKSDQQAFESAWKDFATGVSDAFQSQVVDKFKNLIADANLALTSQQNIADVQGYFDTYNRIISDGFDDAGKKVSKASEQLQSAQGEYDSAQAALLRAQAALAAAQAKGNADAIAKADAALTAAQSRFDGWALKLAARQAELVDLTSSSLSGVEKTIADAVNQIVKADADYYAAIQADDENGLQDAIKRKVAATEILKQLDIDQLSDRAKAILKAGQNLISAEEAVGQDQIAAAEKTYEQQKQVALKAVMDQVDAIGKQFENGEITWGEATAAIAK